MLPSEFTPRAHHEFAGGDLERNSATAWRTAKPYSLATPKALPFPAEGEGFEPSEELSPFTRFPSVRTRPDYAIPPGAEDCITSGPDGIRSTHEAGA